MAGGRGDRGLHDRLKVSGVRMWLEVGAMYQEPQCGAGSA